MFSFLYDIYVLLGCFIAFLDLLLLIWNQLMILFIDP